MFIMEKMIFGRLAVMTGVGAENRKILSTQRTSVKS